MTVFGPAPTFFPDPMESLTFIHTTPALAATFDNLLAKHASSSARADRLARVPSQLTDRPVLRVDALMAAKAIESARIAVATTLQSTLAPAMDIIWATADIAVFRNTPSRTS